MHLEQLLVRVGTVKRLIADQFPAWTHLPIRDLGTPGTVNALFRIGDELAARFPLQPMDPTTARIWLEAEMDAAHELHGRTPVPTPQPIAMGEPGHGYPLPWSVQTWLPGTTAAENDVSDSQDLARDIAAFVRAVRSLDTHERTFDGQGRGGDLRTHDDWVGSCLARSEDLFDVSRLRRLWLNLRELPRTDPDVMTHGDLIPGNVLVASGRLSGVLDVGGLGAADPALDLVGAWHLLEARPRATFRSGLGCDDLQWARGQAWALEQALGAAWYYRDSNRAMYVLGITTVRRILEEPADA